jgi:magnesium chelatase subunit D
VSDPTSNMTTPWQDALLAASMLAVDPRGLRGIHVRARHGPVRDKWLEIASRIHAAKSTPRRISAGIAVSRLTGGLDVGASIERGRPVVEQGALAAADGRLLVLAMADRLEPAPAAIIGLALDEGEVRIERDGISASQQARFCLIALDEGTDGEGLSASLADRLGLRLDLGTLSIHDLDGDVSLKAIEAARSMLPNVEIADALIEAACAICLSAGMTSMRTTLLLVRAARIAAALRANLAVDVADMSAAIRLVLGLRLEIPDEVDGPEESTENEPTETRDEDRSANGSSEQEIRDIVLMAAQAALPKDVLARVEAERARRHGTAGKAGPVRNRARRGRSIGSSEKPATPDARLDVLATLRQAAPWQRARAANANTIAGQTGRLRILRTDFRYPRFREKAGTTAIFAVDASGSAAVERLAETKGAIELLLSECYVRRDQVALLAFRGRNCETLLEPTRSLVRAKRCLSGLPGGGGTPLATGILGMLAMADASARKGQSVVTVFLTDGRGNVDLDGGTAKNRVAEDTDRAARMFRSSGFRAIVIDTGQRPQPRAEALSHSLGAEYLALPRGGSRAVAREIGARMEG